MVVLSSLVYESDHLAIESKLVLNWEACLQNHFGLEFIYGHDRLTEHSESINFLLIRLINLFQYFCLKDWIQGLTQFDLWVCLISCLS